MVVITAEHLRLCRGAGACNAINRFHVGQSLDEIPSEFLQWAEDVIPVSEQRLVSDLPIRLVGHSGYGYGYGYGF